MRARLWHGGLDDPAEAARFARAFDREDCTDLGGRAPPVAGQPLRLAGAFRRRPG